MYKLFSFACVLFLFGCASNTNSNTNISYPSPVRVNYCAPTYQLNVRTPPQSEKVIRNLPEADGLTHVSELGDSVIQRAEFLEDEISLFQLPQPITIIIPFDNTLGSRLVHENSFSSMPENASDEILSFFESEVPCSRKSINSTNTNLLNEEAENLFTIANHFLNEGPGKLFINVEFGDSFEMQNVGEDSEGVFYSIHENITTTIANNPASNYDNLWEYQLSNFPLRGIYAPKNLDEFVFLIFERESTNQSFAYPTKLPLMSSLVDFKKSLSLAPVSDTFFDQRLIYNGISGSTVKFLYREFSGRTNRVAFEQEVTYDLEIGQIIGFKGARFKILAADNTQLQYEVVQPFRSDN
jgi:hypothetical protein